MYSLENKEFYLLTNPFAGQLEPKSESENEKNQKLLVSCLTNCALSELSQGHYVDAINLCNHANSIDPGNFKAFVRRAQAHKARLITDFESSTFDRGRRDDPCGVGRHFTCLLELEST